jgi:carnitine 3-dehydrogenase
MRHFLNQVGPSLRWPWSRLTDVPDLDDALIEKISRQSDAQASGRSIRELERMRDDGLVAVIKALREVDWGAGSVFSDYENRRRERAG